MGDWARPVVPLLGWARPVAREIRLSPLAALPAHSATNAHPSIYLPSGRVSRGPGPRAAARADPGESFNVLVCRTKTRQLFQHAAGICLCVILMVCVGDCLHPASLQALTPTAAGRRMPVHSSSLFEPSLEKSSSCSVASSSSIYGKNLQCNYL